MTLEEWEKRLDESDRRWRELERNDPEEYRRQVERMQPIIDRYLAESQSFDDDDEELDD